MGGLRGVSDRSRRCGPPRARFARRAVALAAASLAALSACAGKTNTTTASGGLAFPQVEDNGGGILVAPNVVTVTFDPSLYTNATTPSATTLLGDLQSFDDVITTTSWWSAVTKDYCDPKQGCIGAGTAGAHVSISAAPAGDGTTACGPQPCYTDSSLGGPSSLQTYLGGLFSSGALPAPNAHSLFVFYLPASVTIDLDGALSCVVFGGYHGSVQVAGLDVPYAIVPMCDPQETAQGIAKLTLEQTATLAASHEIVEAVTDPHAAEVPPGTSQNSTQGLAWYLTDDASAAWTLPAGGEIADLCVDILGLGQDRWTESGYVVQRVWSNSCAAAKDDPCVPTPSGEVYFNAGPSTVASDQLTLAVGKSGSIQVDAFADGTMPAWKIVAVDIGTDANGNPANVLSLSPGEASPVLVSSGATIPLAVTLTADPPAQVAGTVGYEPYLVVSVASATSAHYWPAVVLVGH